MVHVVHTREEATAGDVAIDGESMGADRALVRSHLDRLAAQHVPAAVPAAVPAGRETG
jgi:predicted ArsR family transcriptional regulator